MPDLAGLVLDGIDRYGYALVAGLAFVETAAFLGLLVPGETAVVLAGVLAGGGNLDLGTLLWVVPLAAWCGDQFGYLLGRRYGTALLMRHGPKVRLTPEAVARVEGFFARRGGMTVLLGRFVGFARAITPFIAGSSRMRYPVFAGVSAVGCLAWGVGFTLLGYFAGSQWHRVSSYVARGATTLAILALLVAVIVLTVRWLSRNEERLRRWRERADAALAGRPRTARALAVLIRPMSFLARRLSPRQAFGLDLTAGLTLIAALTYALVFVLRNLGATESLGRLDRWAVERIIDSHTPVLGDLAGAVTHLGDVGVLAAIVLAVAAAAVQTGRIIAAIEVLAASVGAAALMLVLRFTVDRPRPADLGQASDVLSSFPSAHAMLSTAVYGAVAYVLSTCWVDRWSLRVATWTLSLLAVAAVAWSRVYLGLHYASDVLAGVVLGALWAAITLTVAEPLRRARPVAPRPLRRSSAPGSGRGGGPASPARRESRARR